MVISTTVYMEHPDLALVPTIRAVNDVEIGVVSDAGTDPQHDVHFFWVEAGDFGAVEGALAADHTVDAFDAVAEANGRRTYRIEYSDAATLISPSVVAAGGLVLSSRSHATGWKLELQLPDHGTLEQLAAAAEAEDVRFDVVELHQAEESDADPEFGLTERQIEALVTAYLNGYYDCPGEASLDDLAAIMDVSRTAVSGRLRRGSARLIEETLVEDDRSDARVLPDG